MCDPEQKAIFWPVPVACIYICSCMYVFVNQILRSDESIKRITTEIEITMWDLASANRFQYRFKFF
jgi:hypothetical protein